MATAVQDDWLTRVLGFTPDRVAPRRKALLADLAKLTDPPYADKPALAALKIQRDAAAAALAPERPTAEQFAAAEKAMAAFASAAASERVRVVEARTALLAKLGTLSDPAGAVADEKKAMKAERDKAAAALTAEAPTPAALGTARTAIEALAALTARSSELTTLAGTRPKAAAAARTAFQDFAGEIGTVQVTDELVAQAGQATAAAQGEIATAETQIKAAKALPSGTKEEKRARARAIKQATTARDAAIGRRDAAAKRENALFGQKSLGEALAHGPLSTETARPFGDDVAEKLIAGYSKDSRLAAGAVDAATTAKYPEAIANALGPVTDRAKDGFKSSTGTYWKNPGYARDYGAKILGMAGDVGSDYMAGFGDYIDSGQQFTSDPMGDAGQTTWSGMAQHRSVVVASALVKPDGSTDMTTPAAKNAIGNALYHPETLDYRTPALNEQILKTTKFLGDPIDGPKANGVLQGMGAPQPGAAQALVRSSLGKGATDPVTATDGRVATVASMLKPLDQGPVGSCFATAPARRMRETDPLEALKSYGEIASKGTYTPPNGPKVPAVTNLPANEDPLMRSLEYSLATSTARVAGSDEATAFQEHVDRGLDQLKDKAVADSWFWAKNKDWTKKKQALRQAIADGFTFVYDPLSEVTDANDGSSSTGRYVIQRKSNGAEIRSKDDFVKQMGEVVVAACGMDPKSKDAGQLRAEVGKASFIDAVCPRGYKPWELSSGGQTPAAAKTLNGPTVAQHAMLAETPKGTPTPEGARTADVLTSFLNNLGGSPEDMVTIRTVGMHGFNALPNDPSLAPLKGANPTQTGQKIKANLIDKGTALKNTDLSPDRAAWMFDQEIAKVAKAEKDSALKARIEAGARAKRPTAAMKPAALETAIKEALADYQDAAAGVAADSWKQSETAKGHPPAPTAVADKKRTVKEARIAGVATSTKNAMIRDMGAPEFVIADTNWGDARDHTFFVVAPDPTTGEPQLWMKTEPPGALRPAPREWVDAEWASIH